MEEEEEEEEEEKKYRCCEKVSAAPENKGCDSELVSSQALLAPRPWRCPFIATGMLLLCRFSVQRHLQRSGLGLALIQTFLKDATAVLTMQSNTSIHNLDQLFEM